MIASERKEDVSQSLPREGGAQHDKSKHLHSEVDKRGVVPYIEFMKALFILLGLLAVRCADIQGVQYAWQDPEVNFAKACGIGESIIQWESGLEYGEPPGRRYGTRKVLAYYGTEGRTMRIGYKEYDVRDGILFIRSSSVQNLSYDLSRSDTIDYEEIRIRVDSSETQRAKFILLRGPH